MHIAPCAAAVAAPPPGLAVAHALCAYALYAAWALLVSGGTMRLDACYVPVPEYVWHVSSAVGVASMLAYASAVGC